MIIKKNNFYVISIPPDSQIKGIDEEGNEKITSSVDIVFFHTGEDIETSSELRDCTELEKEYWLDEIDKINVDGDFMGISLDSFEDWKKKKGIIL
jgi:hypothetical protein